jgi:GGDEF domain-containing protein
MKDDLGSTYGFLTRVYAVVKVIALTTVSVAGILVSVVAFNVTVSQIWTGVSVPLYVIALVGIPVLVIYGILMVVVLLLLKDALGSASYYKHSASNLAKSVSYYQDLAFNDPITGMPNSRGLEREFRQEQHVAHRCLILLDLMNFGQINNKYNHWKGDEYLRRFAEMVSSKSRRDEYVFKKRPIITQETPNDEGKNVKAFRKYSGGDEFYILIEGTIVDGIGFLNRLQKRSPEFERMAFEVLNNEHPFGFHAGLIAVGLNEEFQSIEERSAQCLQLAKDKDNPIRLYWNDKEMPPIEEGSFQKQILNEAKTLFKN